MNHELVAYEEYFLEDDVRAVCACGWKSDRVYSLPAALVEHQIHQREAQREEELAR